MVGGFRQSQSREALARRGVGRSTREQRLSQVADAIPVAAQYHDIGDSEALRDVDDGFGQRAPVKVRLWPDEDQRVALAIGRRAGVERQTGPDQLTRAVFLHL